MKIKFLTKGKSPFFVTWMCPPPSAEVLSFVGTRRKNLISLDSPFLADLKNRLFFIFVCFILPHFDLCRHTCTRSSCIFAVRCSPIIIKQMTSNYRLCQQGRKNLNEKIIFILYSHFSVSCSHKCMLYVSGQKSLFPPQTPT